MTSMPISTEKGSVLNLDSFLVALVLGARQTAAGWQILAGRCLYFVLLMVVISALWDKVTADQVVGAVRLPGDLALYVGATEWITLSIPAFHSILEGEIRSGRLETHLLRPKAYFPLSLAQAYGGSLVRLGALGLTGLAMLAVSGRTWPPLEGFAFLAVLGLGGLAVGLLLYALAGLAAFWTRRVLPFQLVIQKLMFLLGGLFAPVTLYPAWLSDFSQGTPFAAHLYWAGRQMLEPSLSTFLQGLVWQGVWIGLLTMACAGLWSAGEARVLREGGV